ncbi:MAG: hypothetical protein FJW35_17620, partial [Acidobacteria bacterium]|nr:hypothetical protein [Acidobacteriota bacterium]
MTNERGSVTPGMRVIAALPFANQSRPEDGFLADALTELLIAELGKAGRLEIISWNSTRHYRNTDRPWNHVARQLGAEGIISGSLARTGDSFRIQAALINPKAAEPVWRRGFRREIRRLPEVLRSIVKDIARDTGAGLTPAEKRRLSRGPEWDGSALESYWRALHAWNELSEDA